MKLNIFYSTTSDGLMSNNKKYYPQLSKEEINLLYRTNRQKYFQKINFPETNVINLNTNLAKKITACFANLDHLNPKSNIILLKENAPNILVSAETSTFPFIVATTTTEKKISAITLGRIENLNNHLLHELIEVLIQKTNAAPFEITFYIGPCQDNYEIKNPILITNSYWKKALEKKGNKTYLNLRLAILNELINEIVDPNYIYFDTTKNNSFQGQPFPLLACCLYTEE